MPPDFVLPFFAAGAGVVLVLVVVLCAASDALGLSSVAMGPAFLRTAAVIPVGLLVVVVAVAVVVVFLGTAAVLVLTCFFDLPEVTAAVLLFMAGSFSGPTVFAAALCLIVLGDGAETAIGLAVAGLDEATCLVLGVLKKAAVLAAARPFLAATGGGGAACSRDTKVKGG